MYFAKISITLYTLFEHKHILQDILENSILWMSPCNVYGGMPLTTE